MNSLITATTLAITALTPLMISSCATTATTSTQLGVKPYPLKTCIVTDSKLGSMGDPVVKVYNGQEIKFCCAPCVKKFEANPDKFLKKLNK